jgi:hypothetical protein
VERGFAGQGPGVDARVDKVTAPGSGVTGHEEADCHVRFGRSR